MKKWFIIGAFLCGILGVQSVDAGYYGYRGYGYGNSSNMGFGDSCCGESPTGDCICRYVRYEPCYYNTSRCVDEQVPCVKQCCRYRPEYYQVQRCRYVPQYYCETRCRQVPEYYNVTEYKCCKRVVCEPQCRYIPRYYWKRTCCPENACCN